MAIGFRCNFCDKMWWVKNGHAGREFQCLVCRGYGTVPVASLPAPSPVVLQDDGDDARPSLLDGLLMRDSDPMVRGAVALAAVVALLFVAGITFMLVGRQTHGPATVAATTEPAATPPSEKRADPQPVRVQVTTVPAGAWVTVGGKEVGPSPVEADFVGREEVVADSPGYENAAVAFDPVRDAGGVKLTLKPKPAVVSVRVKPADATVTASDPAATVAATDGGARVSVADPDPARPLVVRLARAGYRPLEKAITVRPGQSEAVSLALEPEVESPKSDTTVAAATPPAPAPAWGVADLSSRRVPAVQIPPTGGPRSVPENLQLGADETFLEVTGLFTQPVGKKGEHRMSDFVLLTTAGGRTTEHPLAAIGLCGTGGKPSYTVSKNFRNGVIATVRRDSDLGLSVSNFGDDEVSLTVSVAKTPLTLAFAIPKDAVATYELRVAGTTTKFPAAAEPQAAGVAARMAGTWHITELGFGSNNRFFLTGETPGVVFQAAEGEEAGTWTVRGVPDSPGGRAYLDMLVLPTDGKFKLDPKGEPVAIDFTGGGGKKVYAIAKFTDPDTLVICVSDRARPGEFDSNKEPKGGRRALLTLKRKK